MAIKLKNNKWLLFILSMATLLSLSIFMYALYPKIESKLEQHESQYYEDYDFIYELPFRMYLTYIQALQGRYDNELEMVEELYDIPTHRSEDYYAQILNELGYGEYIDDYYDEEELLVVESETTVNIFPFISETEVTTTLESPTVTYTGEIISVSDFSALSQEQQLLIIKTLLVELLEKDIENLESRYQLKNVYFTVQDETNQQLFDYYGYESFEVVRLSSLLEGTTKQVEDVLADFYQYYVVFNFDSLGTISIETVYGEKENGWSIAENIKEELKNKDVSYLSFKPIKDMTYAYGVPKETIYPDVITETTYYFGNLVHPYMKWYVCGAVGVIVLLVILLPLKTIESFKVIKRIFKWPIEVLVLLIWLLHTVLHQVIYINVWDTIAGYLLYNFPDEIKLILLPFINVFMWFAWFIGVFLTGLAIKKLVVQQGWSDTLTKNSFLYPRRQMVIKKVKQFFRMDLKDKNTKKLLFWILVQAAIIYLCCCVWFLGIPGVLLYSGGLFFILKKHLTKTQADYHKLLNVTKQLANGNLNVKMDEDLGMFNSFKDEIVEVQVGFKKAVEAEVKSQRMRTDLIANVSHDLKTPLTSIITYTDLLKDETLDESKRADYLATLDQKAHRLKILIEDLFEMSKASSGNIVMNRQEVDVTSLMKQTLLELEDKIIDSKLIIRRNFPTHKVALLLDSERTFRVFDNLILNMTKYAMPRTRAYIDILDKEQEVQIIFKNMSATELSVNADELTERFVRGDKSRHTDGSGLGLAIAKSFVELQDGTFDLVVDGDLFKVIITFKK